MSIAPAKPRARTKTVNAELLAALREAVSEFECSGAIANRDAFVQRARDLIDRAST